MPRPKPQPPKPVDTCLFCGKEMFSFDERDNHFLYPAKQIFSIYVGGNPRCPERMIQPERLDAGSR